MAARKGMVCLVIGFFVVCAGFPAAPAAAAGPSPEHRVVPNPPEEEPETPAPSSDRRLRVSDGVYRVGDTDEYEAESELVRWHRGWGYGGFGRGFGYGGFGYGGWGRGWRHGGWGYGGGWGWGGRRWAFGRPFYRGYYGYPGMRFGYGYGYPMYANQFAYGYGSPYGYGGYGMGYPYGYGGMYW